MPSGALYVSHHFQGETGYVIMTWAKSTTPLTEIGRVVYAAPHVQEFYNIENLAPVWHIIRFWRSADGVSLDEEINILAGNARNGSVYQLTRYEYIVGRGLREVDGDTDETIWEDPAQDDDTLIDTRLAGGKYFVEERMTGSMLDNEFTVNTTGGFTWTGGKVFNDGGVYFVYLMNRLDMSGGDDTGVDSDTIIITGDIDFSVADHNGKTLLVQGSAQVVTIAIPNLTTIADSKFKVVSHLGAQFNVVVQFDEGDHIIISQQEENEVILGVGEAVEIEFINNTPFITNDFNYDTLGDTVLSWSNVAAPNRLKLSGQTIADVTTRPRLKWILENRVETISISAWDADPKKSKWGMTGNVVRVPLITDFLRASQTGSGSYFDDTIGPHTHPFNTGDHKGRSDNANDRDVMIPETPGDAKTTGTNTGAGTETAPKHVTQIPYMII